MIKRILKELKVIVAEDETKIAEDLKDAMGDSFYSFLLVNDGKEALELYHKTAPDIIISDISMPHISGLELAKAIREQNPAIPIIIMSAYSDKEKLLQAIDLNINKYFIKPIFADELLSYIKTLAPRFESKVVELDDDFIFKKTAKTLYKGDRFVHLSKNEIKFLNELIMQGGTLSDESIKELLWQEDASDERLRTFIRRLRSKTSKNLIKNIKGVGYRI